MSFLLNLQEIRYFHAKTSEVYDPRNPSTGEAFAFPDLDDLANHVESRIKVKEAELEELEDEISDLKNAIGEESAESMPKSSEKYKEMQAQMSDLHLRLMHADATLLHEVNVAETAAQLQLAVMWYCHWKFDFPPRFLAQLSGDSSVPEDGRAAFKQVNWIDVARDYLKQEKSYWRHLEDRGEESGLSIEDLIADIADTSINAVTTVASEVAGFKSPVGRRPTPEGSTANEDQELRFSQLRPFVDYLEMLRDVLLLHTSLVSARSVKYWDGPKPTAKNPVEVSSTIQRAYQKIISKYNLVGKTLQNEMQKFPDEIQAGFSEPDAVQAGTIEVMAHSVQHDLREAVRDAGVLGLYFPGSPLWELRRKLREHGLYAKASHFWESIKLRWDRQDQMCSTSAMTMYLQADEIGGFENDEEEDSPRSPEFESDMKFTNPLDEAHDAQSRAETGETSPRHGPLKTSRSISAAEALSHTQDKHVVDNTWRGWIPHSAASLVNYDGQFIVDPSSGQINRLARCSTLFPLFIWVKRGLTTCKRQDR